MKQQLCDSDDDDDEWKGKFVSYIFLIFLHKTISASRLSHTLMWCVVSFLLPAPKCKDTQRPEKKKLLQSAAVRARTNPITFKGPACTGCVQSCYLYRKQNYYLANMSHRRTHTHFVD